MKRSMRRRALGGSGAMLLVLAACHGRDPGRATPSPSASASASPATTATTATTAALVEALGDPEKGHALAIRFECNRCHDGVGPEPAAAFELQCFHCHQQILAGTFKPPKRHEKRWREGVTGLRDVPTLTSASKRFRRAWLTSFLQSPTDLRPRLAPTMPRLPISAAEARDLAAYLGAPDDAALHGDAAAEIARGDATHGRALLESKGCPSCHVFTGVPALTGAAKVDPADRTVAASLALAPDLRYARERLHPDALIGWLTSPKQMKADTSMPELPLTPIEVRDIAAYLMTSELAAIVPPPARPRLPPLARPVTYDEVSARVFKRTCWHCHGEPDYAVGDGGPGNTGGFGFKPRGLNLVDYSSVASGFVDDQGERHSAFEPLADGTPRMVAALLARSTEEAGSTRPDVRGMPLGYPALSPEEIQLVESWVAQGRPR
ncbi:MAG: c-type cytochrome [Byssovorax sp.]